MAENVFEAVKQSVSTREAAADGDVIDFTAKLFDLSPKEAAEKLAQDFGPKKPHRENMRAQKFRDLLDLFLYETVKKNKRHGLKVKKEQKNTQQKSHIWKGD